MSDEFAANFLAEVRPSLSSVGLPDDLRDVIGMKFLFVDAERHAIAGTVTSFGFSLKEGVKLYVSTPRFCGKNIKYLAAKGGRISAVTVDAKMFFGSFRILV